MRPEARTYRYGPSIPALALTRLPQRWRMPLARLALAWVVLILAFLPDWAAMAHQWWTISTYAHVILVPPIVAWLAWERAPQLARFDPVVWWPGLAAAGAASFLWVLGDFSGIATARQLAAVLLLIAATLGLLGPKLGAGLAFPLGYMLFLVPFGDELVPALQMITAAITIALVHLSRIPAAIDGVFINTPAGLFEVAEACSGVKFLIAMIAFGALVANLCFARPSRRALFMAACVLVPVLANGVRAWATILAAQFFGAEVASGFDHVVYGWIFFGCVIAVVLALSWRFFDRPAAAPQIDTAAIAASPLLSRLERFTVKPALALAALALVVGVAQGWAHAAHRLDAPLPARAELPPVTGWERIDYRPEVLWEPRAAGADRRLRARYRDRAGRVVDVFVAIYAGQGEGREAGGFGEGALTPGGPWNWLSPGPSIDGAQSDRLLARGGVARVALTWYRSGTLLTGSNARLKLSAMADRLLLRRRATVMLILSAEERAGQPAGDALASYRRAMGPLDRWMDRLADVR